MNNRLPNAMLNFRPDGGKGLGRPLRRQLDEDKTGTLRPNSWLMIMMVAMIIMMLILDILL